MIHLPLVFVQLAGIAYAANDWSTACHEGQCAWDVPSSSDHDGSASLQLWSAFPSAIADITPAAGWAVLTCSGSVAAQTVRIACVDPSSGCSHLLDPDIKSVNRMVRLTDECGTMPFARIAHMGLSADQTLPSVLSHRVVPPSVYDVALDTDFGADDSDHGPVNFAVTASSGPSIRGSTIKRVPRGRFQSRAFVDEQEKLAKHAYIASDLQKLTARSDNHSVNENNSASILVHVNRTADVFNQNVDCQAASVPLDTSVMADVDVVADAQIKFGIVIVGTTIPPKVETAAITAYMSGSIDGALRVQANVEGSFSNSVTLFDFPLPGGIVIPNFLQLGPAFRVRASAEADLGNAIDTTIGLSYRIENASLVFPAKHGHGNGTFIPNETPLQLSMDTNVTGSVSLTGHLIPELVIGIDAFKGPAHVQAEFALSLDASATVTVNGTAGITSSTNSSAVVTPPGACVDVGTALAVSAGVNTSLFGIFDADANVNLFNNSFDLYNTCTDLADANSTSSRNSTSVSAGRARSSIGASLSSGTYQWSARGLPVPVNAPRLASIAAQSSNKRPTLTCPIKPLSPHTPTATAKVSPKPNQS